MYQNGKQIKGYNRKKLHKMKKKNKYARRNGWIFGDTGLDYKEFIAHRNSLPDPEYWKEYYISGTRGFAKKYSAKKNRQVSKVSRLDDYEDYIGLFPYNKIFDYWDIIW